MKNITVVKTQPPYKVLERLAFAFEQLKREGNRDPRITMGLAEVNYHLHCAVMELVGYPPLLDLCLLPRLHIEQLHYEPVTTTERNVTQALINHIATHPGLTAHELAHAVKASYNYCAQILLTYTGYGLISRYEYERGSFKYYMDWATFMEITAAEDASP